MSVDPSLITSSTHVSPTILRLSKVNDFITVRGLPLSVTGCFRGRRRSDWLWPHCTCDQLRLYREQTGSTTSFVHPPLFIPATRQDEPQAASKDAPSALVSLKVALRAGPPLSARILNHAPPAGLEHRRSLFHHKTTRLRF